jgi:hypothetical protein
MERLTTAPDWARRHFGGALLGDERRTERLVEMGAAIAGVPGESLPNALGDWAALKAGYRLLASDAVTYERVIASHLALTRDRSSRPGEYFMIEDSTSLNFASRQADDLGWIGDDEKTKGLHLHTTLAVRVERWNDSNEPEVAVVGLLGQRVWARTHPPRRDETQEQRLKRPRESERWAAVFAEAHPQEGHWTYIADRESDIFRVMGDCRAHRIDFLIRGCWKRKVTGEERTIFDAVAAGPVLGTFALDVRSRQGVPGRQARLEVRAVAVTVRPPRRGAKGLEPERENVIEVREVDPPGGVEPIHWVLLTSWPVATLEEALRAVRAYSRRWLIEEYHKALKTGAGMERSQLSTRDRLEALLGVLAVVAVRLLSMKLLCASKPAEEVDPTTLGPEALGLLEAKYGRPKGRWTNRSVLVAIARLGGFLARKGDGDPGWITIWRGWRKLMTMIQGLDLFLGGLRSGQ